MKILHITSVTNPKGNGVAVAVYNYYKYESEYAEVAIYNVENNVVDDAFSFNISQYSSISALPNGFDRPDIVVFNEVYKKIYLRLYQECINRNIPYIIIPHGCLTKKSQHSKFLKKKIANILLFNKFISHAKSIQYLNELERKDSIFHHRCFISGNGIVIPKKSNQYIHKDFVYIGRYDIKVKGLDLLVNMIIENKEWFIKNHVKIKLYGRDSCNGYEILKKKIMDNNISNILLLNGPVYDKEKEKILLKAYAFIQVSRHEGQPMGIIEALSYRLPCIVTYGTSFGNYVNECRCGIGISFQSNELFTAIKTMLEDEKLRSEFSFNSKVVEKDFNWNIIAKECVNKYKELL